MNESIDTETPELKRARGHHGMALGWLKRGRTKHAIASLRSAIETDPGYLDPFLELGKVFLHLRRWDDLLAVCKQGLIHHLEVPELHKYMIHAISERDGRSAAYQLYGLERLDEQLLDIQPDEILCCVVVRNELERMPALLDHYRRLGVHRFLIADNASTDGTAEWCLTQKDVHIWVSSLSFKKSNFGSSWFELLLGDYGRGHWCLTIDADEFVIYNGWRHRTLRDFCAELDRRNYRVATGMLLDMYSDRPISQTTYRSGDDPLELCPFFDREAFGRRYEDGGQYRNQTIFFGGVRQRVFPAEHDYLLSKALLLRYESNVVLTSGQHLTSMPAQQVAKEQICVLHFKFFASFENYANSEAQREIHAMGGEQYKAYDLVLKQDRSVSLYEPELSVRFKNTEQLCELGIMAQALAPPPPHPCPIDPQPAASSAPWLSIMITAYDRTNHIERALQSALEQSADDIQIEVVCDCKDMATQAQIADRTAELAGDRVKCHLVNSRLGHPHIFNLAIQRAQGKWVQILHDDDWLEPGFVDALRTATAAAPDAATVFCQHVIVDVARGGEKTTRWDSWVERETPGVIEGWFDRIARECRAQFSSMVVRRSAYEAVGGFCTACESAFDWEMWVRLAAHGPAYYIPEVLVGIGRDDTAETSRLMRTGEQIDHAFAAIRTMLQRPGNGFDQAQADRACDQLARYAGEVAREYLAAGDTSAAARLLGAAVNGRPSPRAQAELLDVIAGRNFAFRG